jgi:hypothetical protein
MKKNSHIMKIKLTITIITILILTIFTVAFDTIPAVSNDDELTVTKNTYPSNIGVGGGSPDTFTTEINVTGYGGIIEETRPIDVVYAIDSSENMIWNDPNNLRLDAAKNFTDLLDPTRDQAGVVSWGLELNFTYGLTNDFTTLKAQIDTVDSDGGSDPDLGLEHAISMLDANTRVEDSVKIIIFFSDGDPSPEQGTYTPSGFNGSYTDEAASKGYLIFSIYLVVEGGSGEENLMDMALGTGGVYYSSPTMGNLEAIFNLILETIVTDTSPFEVDVVEVTEIYIVDESNFGIAPDNMVEVDGKTRLTWLNVAQHVGNNDNRLSADETFSISFSAKVADEPVAEINFVSVEHDIDTSTWTYNVQINGGHYPNDQYPVDAAGEAVVNYYDYEENLQTVNIPQGYITVNEPDSHWNLEWCGESESIESASHTYTYGDDGTTGIHGIRFEYPSDQKSTNVTYWFTLIGDYDEDSVNVGLVRGIGADNIYLTSVNGPVWTYNIAPEFAYAELDPTETYMTADATTDLSENHGYGASSVTFKWYGPFQAPPETPSADSDKLKTEWTQVDSDGSDGFNSQTSYLTAEDVGVWFVTAKFTGGLHPGEATSTIGISALSCSVSPSDLTFGDSLTVLGSISPSVSDVAVTLTYTKPDGSTFTRIVTTNPVNYTDIYTPDMLGAWTVSASWEGDATHEEASSSEVLFTVSKISTVLSCSVSPSDLTFGDSLTVLGSISPSVSDVAVTLTYTKPDGSTFTRTVTTGTNSNFSDSYTPNAVGTWSVNASWEGDSTHEDAASKQSFKIYAKPSMQDDKISFSLIINDINVFDAQNESNAIILNAGEVTLYLEWINTGNSPIKLHQFELGFTFLDLNVYSLTYDLGNVTQASSSGNHTFNLDFKPILQPGGVNLFSGVYKVTCKLIYEILQPTNSVHSLSTPVYMTMESRLLTPTISSETSQTTDSTFELSTPFYLKMETNMLSSILGITVAAGTVITGVTIVGAIRGTATTLNTVRFLNSVTDVNKLMSFSSISNDINVLSTYQKELLKITDLPKQTLKRMLESAKKRWEGKKCPKCKTKWSRKAKVCIKCGITIEEAKEIFGDQVVKLSIKARAPISKTARGMGLKVLERYLGVDTATIHLVLKTMVDVGIVKTKVSPRFIIKKLVTNGIKMAVTTIILLQVSGLKVFGASYLILAVILGASIPFSVGYFLEKKVFVNF